MEEPDNKNVIAEFSASIPPIQSAVTVGQDGARVKLDIPESELAEVMKLIAYGRDRLLRITVEAADD